MEVPDEAAVGEYAHLSEQRALLLAEQQASRPVALAGPRLRLPPSLLLSGRMQGLG